MKRSSNTFSKVKRNRGRSGWIGENLTSNEAPGSESLLIGNAPGIGAPGGYGHFGNLTKPNVGH